MAGRHWLWLGLLLGCSGCALFKPADKFGAREISFEELSGWQQDDHLEALNAFLATCPILSQKSRSASSGSGIEISEPVWQSLCDEGARVLAVGDASGAREFFERRFMAFRVNNNGRERGLFTGYYEPLLYGARRRYGDFLYPVYLPPPDRENGKPYLTRAEIDDGALEGKRLELIWVDDPVMLFFMQIQGSGRIKLTNGREIYVGYGDKNNQPYVALGKVMVEEGLLPKDQVNFFSIRQWLYRNPDKAFALMQTNPSYVFFRLREKPGAVGAAGAVLTPKRSLAVDSRYIPYGLPLFLETDLPPEPQREPLPFHRLMVAQDTGGAIRGPVRGDIFFGAGDEAEYFAGYMKGRGAYSLLVPREVAHQIR